MTSNNSYPIQAFGPQFFELFMKPVFFDVDFRNIFRFVPSKIGEQRMVFNSTMKGVLQSGDDCGFTPKGSTTLTERCLHIRRAKINLEQCFTEFDNSLMMQALKTGNSVTDITDTIYESVIIDSATSALRLDLQRLAFFGDTSSPDEALALADGIWTKHIPAMVAANDGIRSIAGGSGALAPGDGLDFVRNIWLNQGPELRGMPNNQKVLLVSREIYDRFIFDREDGTKNSEIYITQLSSGEQQVRYHGILVLPMFFWDENRALFPVAPGQGDPLRAGILTVVDNMVMGSDVQGAESAMEIWHDRKDEKVYFKSRFSIGFNYVHEKFFSVSYEGAPNITA